MQANSTELQSSLLVAQKDEESEREQHISQELGIADTAHTISTDKRLIASYTGSIATMHQRIASLKLVSGMLRVK